MKRTHLKSTSCEGNRLIWCPYINESVDEGQDSVQGDVVEQVLAVTFGNVAEALYISMVKDAHGDTVDIKDVKTGIMRVTNGHKEVSYTFIWGNDIDEKEMDWLVDEQWVVREFQYQITSW